MNKNKKSSKRHKATKIKRAAIIGKRSGLYNKKSSIKSDLKPTKKNREIEVKVGRLLTKGRERGFVTYDEILKEFPTVENDIMFLDDLYAKLNVAGIDLLEGGGLLETPTDNDPSLKKYVYGKNDSSYDSIQMYLKEIGQYPLISASQEKELAKRIQNQDEEAKNILARSNLRLVV